MIVVVSGFNRVLPWGRVRAIMPPVGPAQQEVLDRRGNCIENNDDEKKTDLRTKPAVAEKWDAPMNMRLPAGEQMRLSGYSRTLSC